ncbi:MAG: ERF family protein [Candidatus Spyradocola sp.]
MTDKINPDAEKPSAEASCLTLRQKLVAMRRACPEITRKKYSENVSYKYARIYDVWEQITPVMNELGVDFDVISEAPARHADNGDPIYWITMQTRTRSGDKLMFLYEADLTIRWTNLDNEDDYLETTLHAVGWNDDPAKAKGAAHTYALKCYLFEKFTINQGEDDPDSSDFSAQGNGAGSRQGQQLQQHQQRNGQHGQQSPQNQQQGSSGRLSDAQLGRLYKKAEAAGMSKERTDARIFDVYNRHDPATLTRQEYDEICASLDDARFNSTGKEDRKCIIR